MSKNVTTDLALFAFGGLTVEIPNNGFGFGERRSKKNPEKVTGHTIKVGSADDVRLALAIELNGDDTQLRLEVANKAEPKLKLEEVTDEMMIAARAKQMEAIPDSLVIERQALQKRQLKAKIVEIANRVAADDQWDGLSVQTGYLKGGATTVGFKIRKDVNEASEADWIKTAKMIGKTVEETKAIAADQKRRILEAEKALDVESSKG